FTMVSLHPMIRVNNKMDMLNNKLFCIIQIQHLFDTEVLVKKFLKSIRFILFIATCFCVSNSFSQGLFSSKLNKSFSALEIHDYFKAKKYFQKSIKKHRVPASYGLSIIYYRDNNPFYNLDSALKYIQDATYYFPKLTEKKKLKYSNLGVDSMSIYHQHFLIDEKCFELATQLHSIEAYNKFIDCNINAVQLDKAIKLRNHLAFEAALKQKKSTAMEEFITTYPNAIEIVKAKSILDTLIYYENIQPNTIENNVRFIKNYPNNPFVPHAQQTIYELATSDKKESSFYKFIKSYPENPYTSTAW